MANTHFPRIRRGLLWFIGVYAFVILGLTLLEPHLVYQPRHGTSDPAKAGQRLTLLGRNVPALHAVIDLGGFPADAAQDAGAAQIRPARLCAFC